MLQKKALVVDDDNLICWALRKELVNHRLNTRVAGSGVEALSAIREHRFDLVFLDVHLPDANGIHLLKILRESSPETRVVIISGDGTFQSKERALSEGAVQYLEKPFDIRTIARIVESAFLEYPHQRKQPRYYCDIPLRFSILKPSPADALYNLASLNGVAKEVGRLGIRVNSEYPLQKSQIVRLRIAADGDPFSKLIPREATAEVVWAVPENGITIAGLRFLNETDPNS